MNPKRKTQKEAYDPSNGEISLPKVFTMFFENLTTKTLNPKAPL